MANENAVATRPKFEMMAMQARDAFLKIADEKVWSKEIMFAVQILRGSELLQKCDGVSIQNAVINLALTGATLNPVVGQAYLVPRGGKCCLDFSYRGLAGIAMDSGSVKHIAPRLVYDFDVFTYEEIDGEPHIKHAPSFDPPETFTKGPDGFWPHLICGYVVATLHDGTKIVTQPLPKWKLEKAMKTSKTSSGQTPWRTHPDEMCLKTLVKHAYKLLPQTERMGQAVAILNEHEGLEIERVNNSKKILDHIETLEKQEEKQEASPFEDAEIIAGDDVLQAVYKKLTDYASEKGETPDDLISRFTKGKVPALIDLEGKSTNYLNDIALMVDTERDSK